MWTNDMKLVLVQGQGINWCWSLVSLPATTAFAFYAFQASSLPPAGKLLWKGAEMVAGDTNGYGSEEHGDTGGESTPRLSPAGQQTPTGASTRTSLVKMSADKRAKKVGNMAGGIQAKLKFEVGRYLYCSHMTTVQTIMLY